MTTQEKVIHESIARIEKRLIKIDEILNARPHIDLLNLYKEFGEMLNANQGDARLTPDFMDKVAAMEKREKELKIMVNVQKNTIKFIDEKVKHTTELTSLKNELYWIKQRKKG